MKKTRQHQGRALFLTYICGSFVAVLMATPLLHSLSSANASAGAPRRALPTFEQADRDQDGYVSRFESRAVRGLVDVEGFERADSNGDGRIDPLEYARALADLGANHGH